MKIEQRINEKNSVLVGAAGYWALNPGYQFFAEYRHYRFITSEIERFFYGKAGYGHCESSKNLAWRLGNPEIPFNYTLAGAGMGYHFYLNRAKTLIIDLTGGLKLTLPDVKENDPAHKVVKPLFYIAGPGSIIDLNAHFGIQIGSYKLKNENKPQGPSHNYMDEKNTDE